MSEIFGMGEEEERNASSSLFKSQDHVVFSPYNWPDLNDGIKMFLVSLPPNQLQSSDPWPLYFLDPAYSPACGIA